ncbi:serine hydrolase [Streptomyces coelicoflavus]|uniref:serine hydrolase domain-containing protein n=1 Tax=Streptomyces TaxID=1883 RepID=UPI002AD261A8|nr:serine hydrolase domain-containing protein [Streptomyces sp. SYP-A7193]
MLWTQLFDSSDPHGNLRTGSKVLTDGRVRIAGNTKMFTATVVLRLVGESRISLDSPIKDYLSGLVRGEGVDGRNSTVGQLLQHASGLADYDEEVVRDYLTKQRHRSFEPRELVESGLGKKALFAPPAAAGATATPTTSWPASSCRRTPAAPSGDQTIKSRHPHGYFAPDADTPCTDVTEQDPSAG